MKSFTMRYDVENDTIYLLMIEHFDGMVGEHIEVGTILAIEKPRDCAVCKKVRYEDIKPTIDRLLKDRADTISQFPRKLDLICGFNFHAGMSARQYCDEKDKQELEAEKDLWEFFSPEAAEQRLVDQDAEAMRIVR